jgi:KDO2-lipid IV(A) lauroyltransferase
VSTHDINGAKDTGEIPLFRFWQPRFWPLWLGLLVLRVLAFLPYSLQMKLGRALGRLLFRILRKRREIAAANLRLCFPDYDEDEIQKLLHRHFESLGMSVFELALAWWMSDAQVARLVRVDGMENIEGPLGRGQGVALLSGHFSSTELTGRAVRMSIPDIGSVYRAMKNPMVDQLVRRGRGSVANQLIPKDDIRQMIRTLKRGGMVWYAPDQSYNRKYSELVPFFNEPAMTNAALTHIARISKACVVLYAPRRLANDAGYHVVISPPLENFPTEDPEADATRINRLLEEKIRLAPEQYYWIHRRFKNRPAPHPDPYREIGETD